MSDTATPSDSNCFDLKRNAPIFMSSVISRTPINVLRDATFENRWCRFIESTQILEKKDKGPNLFKEIDIEIKQNWL